MFKLNFDKTTTIIIADPTFFKDILENECGTFAYLESDLDFFTSGAAAFCNVGFSYKQKFQNKIISFTNSKERVLHLSDSHVLAVFYPLKQKYGDIIFKIARLLEIENKAIILYNFTGTLLMTGYGDNQDIRITEGKYEHENIKS